MLTLASSAQSGDQIVNPLIPPVGSGVDLRLIGSGVEVPEGYERLSESVVVSD